MLCTIESGDCVNSALAKHAGNVDCHHAPPGLGQAGVWTTYHYILPVPELILIEVHIMSQTVTQLTASGLQFIVLAGSFTHRLLSPSFNFISCTFLLSVTL